MFSFYMSASWNNLKSSYSHSVLYIQTHDNFTIYIEEIQCSSIVLCPWITDKIKYVCYSPTLQLIIMAQQGI